jgi:hypothetical protein
MCLELLSRNKVFVIAVYQLGNMRMKPDLEDINQHSVRISIRGRYSWWSNRSSTHDRNRLN